MTKQLTGRALDEACAKAMGWDVLTYGQATTYHWTKDGTEPEAGAPMQENSGDLCELRSYSTDPAMLGEMLVWLEAYERRSVTGEFISQCEEIRVSKVCKDCPQPWHAEAIGLPPISWAYGATLNETIARLVVVVQEKKP